jgi:hypothetical protein
MQSWRPVIKKYQPPRSYLLEPAVIVDLPGGNLEMFEGFALLSCGAGNLRRPLSNQGWTNLVYITGVACLVPQP